jgi:multidrug efflux pump subunit AcrA (membrane-fusion protein)
MTSAIDKPSVIGPDHQLAAPQSTYSRHRTRWIVLGSLALLVLVIVSLLLISHYRSASKAAALARMKPVGITITSATAESGSIGVYPDSIGTVTPVYTASITSEVTGQIVAVHYREGQLVSKGESLVDIDPRPFQATLLQAQEVQSARIQCRYHRWKTWWIRASRQRSRSSTEWASSASVAARSRRYASRSTRRRLPPSDSAWRTYARH